MPTQEQLGRPFDGAQDKTQDRMVQLDPRSDEFKCLLLKIAEGSDHPNDVAIARILRRDLGTLRPCSGQESGDSDGA